MTNVQQIAQLRRAREEAEQIARAIAAAEQDSDAAFDLGALYAQGSATLARDLVEAHMWFNLAAARGHDEAADHRADVAADMTAREIAEAQRRARRWLAGTARLAA